MCEETLIRIFVSLQLMCLTQLNIKTTLYLFSVDCVLGYLYFVSVL